MPAGPVDFDLARARGAREAEVGTQVVGGAVAVGRADFAARGAVIGGHVDAGADPVPVAPSALQAELQPVAEAAVLVDQQRGRPLVGNQKNAEVAVVVDVAEGRAAADVRGREPWARLRRNVLELAVPAIQEELVGLGPAGARRGFFGM